MKRWEEEGASDDGRYRDTDRVIGCHINRNANKGRYMTNEEKFVNELIGYIFAYPDDDYMTMECLCRKLHKHGLIDKKDGEWTCNFIERADTPQTDCQRCRWFATDKCHECFGNELFEDSGYVTRQTDCAWK